MRFFAEGKIIPERVDLSFPRIELDANPLGINVHFSLEIIKSKIFIHIDSQNEIQIPDLRNILFSIVGDIVNLGGFLFVLGISYEIESITKIDEKWTQVFGAEGYVFDNTAEFGDRLTFRPQPYGTAGMNATLLSLPAVNRATFELRNSIRYPDYTALHCRLAIESVRNHFDSNNEGQGWKKLRQALNVDRRTIELFQEASASQRHGKNVPQTWPQRRQAMQVAWEICHRFFVWLESVPQAPLAGQNFPLF